MKKLTRDEFVEKAVCKHGEKYDYSYVDYQNNRTKVKIVCKTCGNVFYQIPRDHLYGKGCIVCGFNSSVSKRKGKPLAISRTTKFGVGTNDYVGAIVDASGHIIPSYQTWVSMLKRCYDKKWHKRESSYIGCSVCEEWHSFSNFKLWFDENYIEGNELDKDILVKGNKVYSPSTCCFVPKRINSIILREQSNRGKLPIGVTKNKNKYRASCSCAKENNNYIGLFDSHQQAFEAYKNKKQELIKKEAIEYFSKGLITQKVYDALINYKIEITD